MRSSLWSLVAAGLLLLSSASGGAEEAASEPAVEPRARELMSAMAKALAELQTARVETEFTVDVVLDGGQKLQYGGESTSWLRRPDGIRTERAGERGSSLFVYDGERVSLLVQPQNFYATAEAPPTLDGLLDFALDRLDAAPPGVDLLYSDGGQAQLDAATSGTYVGTATIAGRRCHHVAFRAPDVDWQVWIEDGERPLPCRYLITTVDVDGFPETGATFRSWDASPELPDELFTFTPPEGASRIVFREPDAPAGEDAR